MAFPPEIERTLLTESCRLLKDASGAAHKRLIDLHEAFKNDRLTPGAVHVLDEHMSLMQHALDVHENKVPGAPTAEEAAKIRKTLETHLAYLEREHDKLAPKASSAQEKRVLSILKQKLSEWGRR